MKMSDTTRFGFQSAVAVLMAELLIQVLPVGKSYWVTLTAMALSVPSFGEGIKKAFERVIMTILGGSVGTLLYFCLPSDVTILFITLMIFVFFAIYMIPINHQLGVFFITAFVVFLFALVSNWSIALLGYRIIDTLIGAIIALTVGYFFSGKTTSQYDLLIEHWQKLLSELQYLIDFQREKSHSFTNEGLYVDFITLRNQALIARYEIIFHHYNRREFIEILRGCLVKRNHYNSVT